jgi:hypothetical protein
VVSPFFITANKSTIVRSSQRRFLFRFYFVFFYHQVFGRVVVKETLEPVGNPVHTLSAIAPLVGAERRSVAVALQRLRSLAASDSTPEYLRRLLRRNTVSLRHALSVRHRALWLSRAGRVPEALLVLDTAKRVLSCESSPCPIQQIDAWLPVHTRALELLDDTHRRLFVRP